MPSCPSWRRLDALRYHYETQPLPNRLSWYLHQLPAPLHRAACLAMLLIELVVPFLFFAPGPLRTAGAAATIALMVLVQASGNYGFFNLLTIALAVPLLGDRVLLALAGALGAAHPTLPAAAPMLRWWLLATLPLAALLVLGSLERMIRLLRRRSPHPLWHTLLARLAPYGLGHSYGLFAVMTRERPEIVFEGSDDGHEWRPYQLRYKPGDPLRPPRFVAPHQPRLDWQLWFAALGAPGDGRWLEGLATRLLDGSPVVRRLLLDDPFSEHPPRFLRAQHYRYRFTSSAERRRSGAWWHRELLGPYLPAVRLVGGLLELAPIPVAPAPFPSRSDSA